MAPTERLNVYQLLRHPFIAGDSPVSFNVKGNVFEFDKKVNDSSINLQLFNSNSSTGGQLLSNKSNKSEYSNNTNNNIIGLNQQGINKNEEKNKIENETKLVNKNNNIRGKNINNNMMINMNKL
jgi:hypothetical protein